MKAMINLDREATLEILKSLNVDIKPEIIDNYKKLIKREVQQYCQNELYNTLEKYIRDSYVLTQIWKDATKVLRNKITNGQDEAVYKKALEYSKEYLNEVKQVYEKDLERIKSNVQKVDIESIIRDQVDKSVKEYIDRKFK